MQTSEFPQFEAALRRLQKVFTKSIDDEMVQSYWSALKDQKLPVFLRFVERHERHGKFFPKPAELRSKEDKLPEIAGGKDDATFRDGEARCIRNLEELNRIDPEAHRLDVGRRQLDRILATQHQGSSLYEAAYNERFPRP